MRTTQNFSNIKTIVNLYKSIVLSILLYGSQISCPHYQNAIDALESIQHRFLRYASFKMGQLMHPYDHSYNSLYKLLKIPNLRSVLRSNDNKLTFSILHDISNSAPVKELFCNRNLSYNFREPRLLFEKTPRSNYTKFSPITWMRREWNKLPFTLIKKFKYAEESWGLRQEFVKFLWQAGKNLPQENFRIAAKIWQILASSLNFLQHTRIFLWV